MPTKDLLLETLKKMLGLFDIFLIKDLNSYALSRFLKTLDFIVSLYYFIIYITGFLRIYF